MPMAALAQEQGVISGVVGSGASAGQAPITITLHRATDSVAVKTEFAGAGGAFQLAGKVGERYLVSAVQPGYRRYWSPPLVLPATGLSLIHI